ncbi:MAG: deaminase [Candidatus Moranbacteria bacterium]|nr:deaminase [Candidatus Moranbacteria bacterium]
MTTRLTKFDKACLKKAIEVAERVGAHKVNFPVGAVLTIDGEIVDSATNENNKKKSYVDHAENRLIIKNKRKIYKAHKANPHASIFLYSTFEPCIQCLGSCVINHVTKIVYIQKDPHGGACEIKKHNIGSHYKKVWPEIIHAPISNIPKKIMISFFEAELKRGNIGWPTTMLGWLKD